MTKDEKNQSEAFKRSFSMGFGTETDIRDHNGTLVISHDPPTSELLSFEDFIKIYRSYDTVPLALNIKADGLQPYLVKLLKDYMISDYFIFDMSVPDMLVCIKSGLNVFTRQSEYEKLPVFYNESFGVWLDSFESDWYLNSDIEKHIDLGKRVCIVSPELHKRNHQILWECLKNNKYLNSRKLYLCTDLPEEARRFFNE